MTGFLFEVGSTPATIEFEAGYDEEQAGLFPTRFARHVNRSETSRVPHKLLAERAGPFPTECLRNGTSRVPYEKNEDSYVGSTPASTNMFEGDSDEEQAGLFPTDSLRKGTSRVPYGMLQNGTGLFSTDCLWNGARPFPTVN